MTLLVLIRIECEFIGKCNLQTSSCRISDTQYNALWMRQTTVDSYASCMGIGIESPATIQSSQWAARGALPSDCVTCARVVSVPHIQQRCLQLASEPPAQHVLSRRNPLRLSQWCNAPRYWPMTTCYPNVKYCNWAVFQFSVKNWVVCKNICAYASNLLCVAFRS